MKVLAIETATIAGSAAVVDDEQGLIGEVRVDIRVAHAERLMPSIQWLLESSRVSVKDIDAFAVSIGPGSFTGLRIGLSTAKGLSYAAGKPLVPVRTLDAFARTLPYCSHMICPMLDARRNEVYAAFYKWENSQCIKSMPETAINPEELLEMFKGPVVVTGDGAKTYRELILSKLKDKAIFAPLTSMSPSASTVGEIAIEHIKQGITTDPVSLVPYYIRKSEAELNWKR